MKRCERLVLTLGDMQPEAEGHRQGWQRQGLELPVDLYPCAPELVDFLLRSLPTGGYSEVNHQLIDAPLCSKALPRSEVCEETGVPGIMQGTGTGKAPDV